MFGFIGAIFNAILYQPLFNGLIFIYDYAGHDFGIAIILLTVIIRFILYPISSAAFRSQRTMQKLQPKIQEAQKKFKDDKEKQAQAMLEIYKTEKMNPFAGLFLGLIQLPILIALYLVFKSGLQPHQLSVLYSFVPNPHQVHSVFLGLVDLAKANIWFAVLAGVMQFFQNKMLIPARPAIQAAKDDYSSLIQKQMLYAMPVITVVILFSLPSALGLYWIISSLFSVIQQYILIRRHG